MAWEAASPCCDIIASRSNGLPLEAIVARGYWRVAFCEADSMGLHLCGVVLFEEKHHEPRGILMKSNMQECFFYFVQTTSLWNIGKTSNPFTTFLWYSLFWMQRVCDLVNIQHNIWFQTKQGLTNWQRMWEEMGPLIGLILNLALSFASMPNVYCLCIN